VALNEPRQRRVIRPLLSRQHPERDVFLAGALDHPRGPDPARIGVEQQRDHHRRVIRRPAAPIDPIGAIERLEIHLRHRVDNKPREVPWRQPLADVGRHQKRLLAITRDKALAHHQMVLNAPDDTPTYATASRDGISEATVSAARPCRGPGTERRARRMLLRTQPSTSRAHRSRGAVAPAAKPQRSLIEVPDRDRRREKRSVHRDRDPIA
jgi:hypothetical protein